MNKILDLLKVLPAPVQISGVAIILGVSLAYAHETRYMTVSDYTKSYVLDLKALIRDLQSDLADSELTEREREWIEEEIEALLDELCYEKPEDRLCGDRR